MAAEQLNLWSLRWSPAQGSHWKLERTCAADTAAQWLERFQRDEPDTTFRLAAKRPPVPKQAPRPRV